MPTDLFAEARARDDVIIHEGDEPSARHIEWRGERRPATDVENKLIDAYLRVLMTGGA